MLRKILIATPAYGGNVCSAYTESLLYTCMLLSQNNIQFELKFINNQLVTRARNMLSSLFMDNESFTHMIFIDADVVWAPENVLMLIEHDLECVIGIYPNKAYKWVGNKLILEPSSKVDLVNQNMSTPSPNLIRIKHGATGFMLLKKSALLRIQKDVETFILPGSTGDPIILYNYFDCKVVDNDYLTEDYYFSHLFNNNGGIMYADTRIKLRHIGAHEYGELVQ